MTDNIQEKIEDKIIDLIISGAGSRLVVFKPENSDKDLIVEKRGDYKKSAISLNVYNSEPASQPVNPEDNFYLLFVHFDIVKQDIDDSFWVVPSQSLGENDFSKFLTNKHNFVDFLIETLI
jgi:hypothetical protein